MTTNEIDPLILADTIDITYCPRRRVRKLFEAIRLRLWTKFDREAKYDYRTNTTNNELSVFIKRYTGFDKFSIVSQDEDKYGCQRFICRFDSEEEMNSYIQILTEPKHPLDSETTTGYVLCKTEDEEYNFK